MRQSRDDPPAGRIHALSALARGAQAPRAHMMASAHMMAKE